MESLYGDYYYHYYNMVEEYFLKQNNELKLLEDNFVPQKRVDRFMYFRLKYFKFVILQRNFRLNIEEAY